MLTCCSQREAPSAAPSSARSRVRRGAVGLVQWAIPVTILALVPKCPACVAAYVLLFTGVGLSLPAAAAVRWGLIAACVAILFLLLIRTTHLIAARRVA